MTLNTPPGDAIGSLHFFQPQNAVRDALQLHIASLGSSIVQKQNRRITAGEEVLQGQQLPPIAHGVGCQQPQFR